MLRRIFHHGAIACNKVRCTKLEGFSVTAGRLKIFEDVNLHVHCGELMAIIGPNGAGKSTLLKAILGEVAHEGKLKYTDAKGKHTGNPVIGYVPQQLRFDLTTPTSVFDLFMASLSKKPIWLFGDKKIRQRVLAGLKRVKAEYLIDRRLGALSGGELQRVLLALALEPRPDLLLLDEPVSGVDQSGTELFYEMVANLTNEYDMAIILISHDLDLVYKYADKVVLLNKKVITSGTPQAVFADKRTQKLLGIFVQDNAAENKNDAANEEGRK